MSSRPIKPRPRRQPTPRERFLTTNIHISILQFIAALLLTLMLLWHISTVTLVEKYEMPDWWEEDFIAELTKGWRIAVWVVVLFMVPIDCAHALLCLDWWCLLLYGRDDGCETGKNSIRGDTCGDDAKDTLCMSVHKDAYDRSSNRRDRASGASTTWRLSPTTSVSATIEAMSTSSCQPYIYHPLLHERLSLRAKNTLLSILDLILIAILISHIVSYFLSLPQYISHCNNAEVASAPDFPFGDTGKFLNVREGCIKLNVDIHVAGGFSTFMAIVLGVLHIAALVVRGWEFRKLGKVDTGNESERATGSSILEYPSSQSSSIASSHPVHQGIFQPGSAASTTSLGSSKSNGKEERGTGIRFVHWNAGPSDYTARRRGGKNEASEIDKEGSKWDEMLLECLIDA
ncbi:pre-mRNA-splicing factor 8 [Didymella heteroderae]|uniref:Pre-mRNA-splicing factor 8 n=1 Tax=Didymella heteroderae TaxID=1769908 RepID=A0A9P4WLH3_9PLEO|nr:pre-mRNA-splicing factor 8 [Didymella heteroderae]